MSLSNPTLTNPAQHFFEWSGSKGVLQYYDKENQKNIQVKLPFEFIVLDELATIKGYNKQLESGYWSNEIRNVKKDELFVRTKKGPFEAGLYENLAQTRSKGGKYCKSIYIAHKKGGEWMIGNIQAHGSALSSWIEFSKLHATQTGKIIMSRGEKQQAPTGEFYAPEFVWTKWDDDEYKIAVELDKDLQIYLNQYLSAPKVDDDSNGVDEVVTEVGATPEQKADFEQRKAAAGMDTAAAFDPNDPANLEAIPFD